MNAATELALYRAGLSLEGVGGFHFPDLSRLPPQEIALLIAPFAVAGAALYFLPLWGGVLVTAACAAWLLAFLSGGAR